MNRNFQSFVRVKTLKWDAELWGWGRKVAKRKCNVFDVTNIQRHSTDFGNKFHRIDFSFSPSSCLLNGKTHLDGMTWFLDKEFQVSP